MHDVYALHSYICLIFSKHCMSYIGRGIGLAFLLVLSLFRIYSFPSCSSKQSLFQMAATDSPEQIEIIKSEQALYAPFFGSLGVTSAMIFTAAGSAYGTAKAGTGIASMAVARPDLVMKAIIPVVMAGIVAIYGLVVAVIVSGKVTQGGGTDYTINSGFSQFAAGLVCGLCGLGAGYAIGIAGDAGVRALSQQPRMFVGMILILIFAEVLGLYGMIVALIMSSS